MERFAAYAAPAGASAPVAGSGEIPSLRSEGEHLKIERDNAQLRAELNCR